MHNNPWSREPIPVKDTMDSRAWRPLFLVFILGAIVLALTFVSCRASGGKIEVPVYSGFELVDATGHPVGFVLSDTQYTIARSSIAGRAFIVDKATGATLYSIDFTAKNETLLIARPEDVRASFPAGASLPGFLNTTWLANPALVARYGLVIDPITPPTP